MTERTCVVCGGLLPAGRERRDTCIGDCALKKMIAWNIYLSTYKHQLMKAALDEHLGRE